MGYICCLGGFIEPNKSLGGKHEPSKKFRGQKQTLFLLLCCLGRWVWCSVTRDKRLVDTVRSRRKNE
jgi:hypothetical protein